MGRAEGTSPVGREGDEHGSGCRGALPVCQTKSTRLRERADDAGRQAARRARPGECSGAGSAAIACGRSMGPTATILRRSSCSRSIPDCAAASCSPLRWCRRGFLSGRSSWCTVPGAKGGQTPAHIPLNPRSGARCSTAWQAGARRTPRLARVSRAIRSVLLQDIKTGMARRSQQVGKAGSPVSVPRCPPLVFASRLVVAGLWT